jgi:hypothetical protein
MKVTKYILLLTIMLATVSCIKDSFAPALPGSLSGQEVEIALSIGTGAQGTDDLPDTRGTSVPGDARDRYINSLRVLGFRQGDGTLAFNNKVFYDSRNNSESFIGKILVMTGHYTLVLVANEHPDTNLSRALDNLVLNSATLNDVGQLSFSLLSFHDIYDSPMVARVNGVDITTKGAGTPLPGKTNMGDPLRISMERLGIRLDVKLKLPTEQADEWMNGQSRRIHFEGIPYHACLLPHENQDVNTVARYDVGKQPVDEDNDDMMETEKLRLILPEVLFSPATDATRALRMYIENGGKKRTGIIAIRRGATGAGYTIPRNSYLNVTATSKSDYLDITTTASIEDWDNENMNQEL